MSNRSRITIAVLIVLALISGWLVTTIETTTPETEPRIKRSIDFTMQNFQATTMGLDGEPRHRLAAEFMQHFSDDGSSEYIKPHLTFYRPDGNPWHIYSDSGWMSKEGDLVLFLGEVEIVRERSEQNRAMTVLTENLKVRPDDRIGTTEKEAVIISENVSISGTGLRFDWNNEHVEIYSNSRGRYEFIN